MTVGGDLPYNIGTAVTYTITVTNNGPGNATNIQVTDNLPALALVVYTGNTPSQGSYNNVSGIWAVGDLSSGTTATLIIQATNLNSSGTHTNTAEVTSVDQTDPDSTPNNNVPAEDDQDSAIFTAT